MARRKTNKKRIKVALDVSLEYDERPEAGIVGIYIDVKTTGDKRKLLGSLTIPASAARDPAKREEWFSETADSVGRTLAWALRHEAFLHFQDAGNFFLDKIGIDPNPATRSELVELHVNETRARVSNFLKAKGTRSRWTKTELERDVTNALRALRGKHPTLDAVAEILRKEKKEKGPVSGAALGALLKRFGLSWRKLKSDT